MMCPELGLRSLYLCGGDLKSHVLILAKWTHDIEKPRRDSLSFVLIIAAQDDVCDRFIKDMKDSRPSLLAEIIKQRLLVF